MSSPFCIPADPDISGIGVRVAIYTQNLLSFIPAIWALWDRKVSDAAETQSTTILITAFAILITAMGEVQTVSIFHASIVLSLSWMNNTNTFIYFLLYIQHKSSAEEGRIEDLTSWIKYIRENLWASPPLPNDSMYLQLHVGTSDSIEKRQGKQVFTVWHPNAQLAGRLSQKHSSSPEIANPTHLPENSARPRLPPPVAYGEPRDLALEKPSFIRKYQHLPNFYHYPGPAGSSWIKPAAHLVDCDLCLVPRSWDEFDPSDGCVLESLPDLSEVAQTS
jgi:hypothetical protein